MGDEALDHLTVTASAQVALSREVGVATHAALCAGAEVDVSEAAGLPADVIINRRRRYVRRMRRNQQLDQAAITRLEELRIRVTAELTDLA
jgi:hypothetical protein